MPVPQNNLPQSTSVDAKIVAAGILNLVGGPTDLAAAYTGNQFTAPINGQQTSTVIVRTDATVELADVPTSRDGLLARTGASANTVEVTLTQDKYFKIGIDSQGVKPGQVSTELGAAGGVAIIKAGNANLLAALEAQGTGVYFGRVFANAATTSDHVWAAMVNLVTSFQVAEYTQNYILDVRPAVWAKLIIDVASLRSAADPRVTAAQLLGVSTVRIVNLPTALAVLSHRGSLAQAKVLSGIREAVEDFDNIVEGRIKVGSKVLVPAAVLVLKDGSAA